jgi:hypothetical protein
VGDAWPGGLRARGRPAHPRRQRKSGTMLYPESPLHGFRWTAVTLPRRSGLVAAVPPPGDGALRPGSRPHETPSSRGWVRGASPGESALRISAVAEVIRASEALQPSAGETGLGARSLAGS